MTVLFGLASYLMHMCWVELDNEDKTRIMGVLLGYAVVKGLKLIDMDLDVFDERTAVVEVEIVEAEYWIRRFERVRKLMIERDRESCDSARAESLENDE